MAWFKCKLQVAAEGGEMIKERMIISPPLRLKVNIVTRIRLVLNYALRSGCR
jgi:hypothetical protein